MKNNLPNFTVNAHFIYKQAENEETELLIDPVHGEVWSINFLVSSIPSRPFFLIDAADGAVKDTWEGLDSGYYQVGKGPGGLNWLSFNLRGDKVEPQRRLLQDNV